MHVPCVPFDKNEVIVANTVVTGPHALELGVAEDITLDVLLAVLLLKRAEEDAILLNFVVVLLVKRALEEADIIPAVLLLRDEGTLLPNLFVELEELSIVALPNLKLDDEVLLPPSVETEELLVVVLANVRLVDGELVLNFVIELATADALWVLIEAVVELENEVRTMLLLLAGKVVSEEPVLKELIEVASVELDIIVLLMGRANVALLVELEKAELLGRATAQPVIEGTALTPVMMGTTLVPQFAACATWTLKLSWSNTI